MYVDCEDRDGDEPNPMTDACHVAESFAHFSVCLGGSPQLRHRALSLLYFNKKNTNTSDFYRKFIY
jgi:hypothetical protein